MPTSAYPPPKGGEWCSLAQPMTATDRRVLFTEGVECGRLTQQAKTARRRVLFALTVQISA